MYQKVVGEGKPHYALVSHREVVATGTKQEMLELSDTQKGRVWLTKSSVGDIVEELVNLIYSVRTILEYLERKVNQQGQRNTQIYIQMKIQKELYMD